MLAAKIVGATTTEIARQEGLNRDWVRQELASNVQLDFFDSIRLMRIYFLLS